MALPSLTTSQRSIRMVESVKERALRWSQAQAATAHRKPVDAPFKRLIDVWFAGIAWAIAHGIRPVDKCTGDKFVSVGPTNQDVRYQQSRTDFLTLIAIHEFGHEDARAQDPSAIIDLANRYAEAGIEPLLAQLDAARELSVPALYKVADIFMDKYAAAVEGHQRTY